MNFVVPQGKIPFIILNTGNCSTLKKMIAWATKINTYPVQMLILTLSSEKDQEILSYFNKLKRRDNITVEYVSSFNATTLSSLNLQSISNYYVITKSSTIPTDKCPPNLISYLIKAFKDNPSFNKIGTLALADAKQSHISNFMIGNVGAEFALYKTGKSDFRVKKGNLITKPPYVSSTCNELKSPPLSNQFTEKIQKQAIGPYMNTRNILKDRVFTHRTAKGTTTTISFDSDTRCRGWNNCLGDVKIKGRRITIKWHQGRYGTVTLDFDGKFISYTGMSTKDGKVRGGLLNDNIPPRTFHEEYKFSEKEKAVLPQSSYIPLVAKSMDTNILYMVVAAFGLKLDEIQAFLNRNKKVFPDNNVNVLVVTDNKYQFKERWVDVAICKNAKKIWSLSEVLNFGVRGLCDQIKDDSIIVKTDIDIVYSDSCLKNIIKKTSPGKGLVSYCSHISANDLPKLSSLNWPKLPKDHGGKGASFAMVASDWKKLNGYNENLEGWGHDDTELWHRASKVIKLASSTTSPLYHVSHPSRKNDKFPNKAKENETIMNSGKGWKNESWGKREVELGDKKLITFCMCLKNRADQALQSVKSLVTPDALKVFNFIIIEDISSNLLDLSGFEFEDSIDHYIINTKDTWNRSKTLNYGFKRATTPLVASWDSDFRYDKDFVSTLVRACRHIDFNKNILRIDSIESDDSTVLNKLWKKGENRGGQWVYATKFVKRLNGYDESFVDWGHEEMDFHERCIRAFKVKILESKHVDKNLIVTHISHDDSLRGNDISNKNYTIRTKHVDKKTTVVNIGGWGNSKLIKHTKVYKRIKNETKKDTSFAKYVAGKTVAIVGPAPTIVDSKQAEFINSFDIVIRLNKAIPIPQSIADDTGTRCDILYNCLNTDPESGGTLNFDTLKQAGVKWICCPYPPVEPGFTRDIKHFENINKGRFPFHHIDNNVYLKAAKDVGCRPNSGVGTILDILSFQIEQLYITGFTFFQGGYHKDYRGYSEKHVLDFMAAHGNHKQEPQKQLIKRIYDTDQRIVVDPELEKILKG